MQSTTKIPTILGIFLTLLLIGVIAITFEYIARSSTQASPQKKPSYVEVTNISDTTFTVSWKTDLPTTGSVLVLGPDGKKSTYFDDRDLEGKMHTYSLHSVTVRGARPDSSYAVTLLINGKKYDDGVPQKIQTGPVISEKAPPLDPAYGSVRNPDSTVTSGGIVYLTLEGSQKLSTLVKDSGSWIIPLSQIRLSDFSGYLPEAERITETIIVRSQTDEAQAVTDTLNDAPVPDMVVGKIYDFRKTQAAIKAQAQALLALKGEIPVSQSVSVTPTPQINGILGASTSLQATPSSTRRDIDITFPKDGEGVPTFLPQFTGVGYPGKHLTLTIGITSPTASSTSVGTDGIWRYTPSKPLGIGKQSITMTTTDNESKPVAITHMFEILKSGTQVLGIATPSATLAPTTPTPTEIAYSTPTPTETLSGEPMPVTGSALPGVLLGCLGLLLVMAGMGVVFIK